MPQNKPFLPCSTFQGSCVMKSTGIYWPWATCAFNPFTCSAADFRKVAAALVMPCAMGAHTGGMLYPSKTGSCEARVRKHRAQTDRPCGAVLWTCQRAHAEAMPVLYSKNVFFFDQNRDEDHMKARKFVSAIPACLASVRDQAPYALHLIKKVKINFGRGNGVCRQEDSLKDVTRLWSLCKVFGSLEHLSIIYRGWPNGEALGAANISVHRRHYLTPLKNNGRQDRELVFKKCPARVFVVRCDDDSEGFSHLKPVKRVLPLLDNRLVEDEDEAEALLRPGDLGYPYGVMPSYFVAHAFASGYTEDADDEDDKDSLVEIELDQERQERLLPMLELRSLIMEGEERYNSGDSANVGPFDDPFGRFKRLMQVVQSPQV
ncbi:hypothetical protein IWZ01DRAFT_484453 [Phyllosticta capitalensis]